MSWLGIDPGLKGALAELHGDELIVHDMPVVNGAVSPMVVWRIVSDFIINAEDPRAMVEDARSQPSNGCKQAEAIGYCRGILHACLQIGTIPYDRVAPGVWKRKLKLIGKGKEASRQRAIELFPKYASLFSRKKDEGRAEAALIAYYAANQ